MAVFPDAVLYFTFPAVFRLPFFTVQTTHTGFLMVTMFITDLAVHSTWGEHERVNDFRHLQITPLLSNICRYLPAETIESSIFSYCIGLFPVR